MAQIAKASKATEKKVAYQKKQEESGNKVVKYIVNCCKYREVPADIQQAIKQSLFK